MSSNAGSAGPVLPAIDDALARGVDEGVFPGAAAAVFRGGELVHLSWRGDAQRVPTRVPLADEAVFDLASLTKVLATTAAVAVLVDRGLLALDEPVARLWPAFAEGGKGEVTVRHLLAHASGMKAWSGLFLQALADPGCAPLRGEARGPALTEACARARQVLLRTIETIPLERAPGTQAVYSDFGFIALGHLVERVAQERLDRFVAREIHARLGLSSLSYRPLDEAPKTGALIATTGLYRPREPAPGQEDVVPAPDPAQAPRARPGEVDDDNAFVMGGVAGHAGLFGTARDVAAFGRAVLEDLAGANRLASALTWAAFCRRDGTPGSTRALGFDTPSAGDSSAGRLLERSRAIGHLGFTGTSLWIDLERGLSIALLTNRVHPTRTNLKIRAFRPFFHDVVVEGLEQRRS